MIKVDVKGCSSFVDAAKYESYVNKALEAFDVLKNETGAGNDFLGWKKLPKQITDRELAEYEAIRDKWVKKGVDLVNNGDALVKNVALYKGKEIPLSRWFREKLDSKTKTIKFSI